ncbi:DUF4870 domain-containing protein [Phormidesmis priestleyi ULC007]|uniref:DUF4870 domain-containing protein n=1 Tax=Phormidesmis priestleyi ULC007 TaxID=1920490 RepID=A0A2T1D2L4_9CYAN|nr:DUF4870 domain-containing protein [Phormidesmis priestleyi]PSB14644.1 DUF4870 domain-containing protein [Phormidesmis priestleyi ULC007]PZO45743.1 MAG: DUF4870 domain-containing protein [Phormidesmis priestleyi]
MQGTHDSAKRRLLSCLSHGAIFFSTTILSVGVPIAITFISDDPVVQANAKESINFHFNVWFWGILILIPSLLTFGLLGWILFPLGYAIHWGLTIWALAHCFTKPDEPFRYPFIFRLL